MSLQLYCPSDLAVLLLAVPDDHGVFFFPSGEGDLPGLWLPVKPLTPINSQLVEKAEEVLKVSSLSGSLDINQDFAGKVAHPEGESATLYVARLAPGRVHIQRDWLTLPQLLALMPKDRNRLPYLLAWQVLSGALAETTQAVEMDRQELCAKLRSEKLLS